MTLMFVYIILFYLAAIHACMLVDTRVTCICSQDLLVNVCVLPSGRLVDTHMLSSHHNIFSPLNTLVPIFSTHPHSLIVQPDPKGVHSFHLSLNLHQVVSLNQLVYLLNKLFYGQQIDQSTSMSTSMSSSTCKVSISYRVTKLSTSEATCSTWIEHIPFQKFRLSLCR